MRKILTRNGWLALLLLATAAFISGAMICGEASAQRFPAQELLETVNSGGCVQVSQDGKKLTSVIDACASVPPPPGNDAVFFSGVIDQFSMTLPTINTANVLKCAPLPIAATLVNVQGSGMSWLDTVSGITLTEPGGQFSISLSANLGVVNPTSSYSFYLEFQKSTDGGNSWVDIPGSGRGGDGWAPVNFGGTFYGSPSIAVSTTVDLDPGDRIRVDACALSFSAPAGNISISSVSCGNQAMPSSDCSGVSISIFKIGD